MSDPSVNTSVEASVEDLAEAVARGVSVVDVRQPQEYVEAHVPGARLMPMGELPARLTELDRSTPVYVVCASGNRSRPMTDLLRASGFEAYSVSGGTRGWQRSGRPVVTGPRPEADVPE